MCSFNWLTLTFITLHCLLLPNAVKTSSRLSPGELTPQRLEIKTGDSANLTCHMNLQMFPGKNSTSLYFVEEETGHEVSKADYDIINETTIVYMLRDASTQNRNYICKLDELGIGLAHVSVGTAPLDVQDFKCRGYDYLYMVCNFTIPENTITTQYNLSYTAQLPNYLQICHLDLHDTHGICNLTLSNYNYRPNYEFYNFTLIGHNSLGTNLQNFWINHYESVIPARPDIKFEQITTNSVVMRWSMVRYSYYSSKGLQYEIRIRPGNHDWLNSTNHEIRSSKAEYKIKLFELPYAFYIYTISVRMRVRSQHHSSAEWSEPFVSVFETKSCAPYSPPKTDSGSFYIDSTETRVRLYWQQLPQFYENGPNFKYVIEEVKRDHQIIDILPLKIDRTSATFLWDRNHHYSFAIRSRNDVGQSDNASYIYVQPMPLVDERKSPKWIQNVYHSDNNTYTLSWSTPADYKNLQDYTVFWCRKKLEIHNDCEDSLDFKRIKKDAKRFNMEPNEIGQTLILAISANYDDFNSGMHWPMCSVEASGELVKLIPEIAPITSHSIQVRWSTDSICPSLLEGYNLTYCALSNQLKPIATAKSALTATSAEHQSTVKTMAQNGRCLDKPITINIEKTARKHLITDLHPYTNYKIEIFMYSKRRVGNASDPQFVTTMEEAPSPPRSLKYTNISSNSAQISWLPSLEANGKLGSYTIIKNNEKIILNCTDATTLCHNDTNKEIKYKLQNLSSFTSYKVYVIAHTIEPSQPSNDIHFTTLIGIPSNPRNMIRVNRTGMSWSKPEVPSGRVEYYEVALTVWYKDKIQRQRITGVVGATSCVVNVPPCIDSEYSHTFQVRAVNVAERQHEVDHQVFANNFTVGIEDPDAIYYTDNDDLMCVGKQLSQAKQFEKLRQYRNIDNYVQYKSAWIEGPTIACSATSSITLVAVLVIGGSLAVMALLYVLHNKINKMSDIACELPAGLEPISKKGNYNVGCGRGSIGSGDIDGDLGKIRADEELISSKKESLLNNEQSRLLSSVCNDSGYIVTGGMHGGDQTPCSIGKSSGYVGSNHSGDDYTQQHQQIYEPNLIDNGNSNNKHYMTTAELRATATSPTATATKTTAGSNDPYMIMKVLQLHDNDQSSTISPTTTTIALPQLIKPAAGEYIQPGQLMHSSEPSATVNSGYIKPNNLSTWQATPTATAPATQQQNGFTTAPTIGSGYGVDGGGSGYISPQMLQKPKVTPAALSGYTTLEALGKAGNIKQEQYSNKPLNTVEGIATTPNINGGHHNQHQLLPSGYVTHKELSKFGQQSLN